MTNRGAHKVAGFLLLLAAVALTAPDARAAAIGVTTAVDEFNTNLAACSLREAIHSANQNSNAQAPGCVAGGPNDTISVPGGLYRISGALSEDGNLGGDLHPGRPEGH